MRRAHRTTVALLGGIALLLTGCSTPAPQPTPTPTATDNVVAPTALERWDDALAFMSSTTKQPDDPEIIYFDTPGLWALYVSLGPIRPEALNGAEIIPPTTEEQAERWLTFAQPALDWNGFTG